MDPLKSTIDDTEQATEKVMAAVVGGMKDLVKSVFECLWQTDVTISIGLRKRGE